MVELRIAKALPRFAVYHVTLLPLLGPVKDKCNPFMCTEEIVEQEVTEVTEKVGMNASIELHFPICVLISQDVAAELQVRTLFPLLPPVKAFYERPTLQRRPPARALVGRRGQR